MTAFNATATTTLPQSAMPMVPLELQKKNELLCLLIRSSVRHHNPKRWANKLRRGHPCGDTSYCSKRKSW
eukprot:scaffold318_cov96-Skeletonema_dohrnii-CCMP3373.AAC.8